MDLFKLALAPIMDLIWFCSLAIATGKEHLCRTLIAKLHEARQDVAAHRSVCVIRAVK